MPCCRHWEIYSKSTRGKEQASSQGVVSAPNSLFAWREWMPRWHCLQGLWVASLITGVLQADKTSWKSWLRIPSRKEGGMWLFSTGLFSFCFFHTRTACLMGHYCQIFPEITFLLFHLWPLLQKHWVGIMMPGKPFVFRVLQASITTYLHWCNSTEPDHAPLLLMHNLE